MLSIKKEITIQENGFTINYSIENTGAKEIITDEYVHNFTAIDKEFIDENYILKFPFQLKPALFIETVNPEQKLKLAKLILNLRGLLKSNSSSATLAAMKR